MAKTKYLSRIDVIDASDLEIEEVAVPEWGGTLRVRGLTAKEKDKYEEGFLVDPGKSEKVNMKNASAKLFALCVIDEAGNPIFNDEGDVFALGKKAAGPMTRVLSVARRLSGMTIKDMEEITRNLGIAQTGNSRSD